jgi:hypothetical protein
MSKKVENKKSFLDLYKDAHYKNVMIEALCQGINSEHLYSFKCLLEYIINNKSHLFDREEFKGSLYLEEDETLDLILPAIRRVFGKVFIDPPTLFKDPNYGRPLSENKRYELFTMYFNVDDFIDYLIDMFIKSKNCLEQFEYIDRTIETLTLIVDNYVAGLVKKVRDCEHIEIEISRIEKELKREDSLKKILGND